MPSPSLSAVCHWMEMFALTRLPACACAQLLGVTYRAAPRPNRRRIIGWRARALPCELLSDSVRLRVT
eukprot:2566256-Prymnesium_polylepis.1